MSAPVDPARWTALAREAWGADIPDWVTVLAAACDRESQARAAARISYSPAAVSQILRRRYNGGATRPVETAVRAALMASQVACPVLDTIALAACLEHQDRAAAGARGSEMRIRLARACPTCPHHRSHLHAQ